MEKNPVYFNTISNSGIRQQKNECKFSYKIMLLISAGLKISLINANPVIWVHVTIWYLEYNLFSGVYMSPNYLLFRSDTN
jgi:hypothetical protein